MSMSGNENVALGKDALLDVRRSWVGCTLIGYSAGSRTPKDAHDHVEIGIADPKTVLHLDPKFRILLGHEMPTMWRRLWTWLLLGWTYEPFTGPVTPNPFRG